MMAQSCVFYPAQHDNEINPRTAVCNTRGRGWIPEQLWPAATGGFCTTWKAFLFLSLVFQEPFVIELSQSLHGMSASLRSENGMA